LFIRAYSQNTTAPRKEFVWFENSGRFPFFEEKQKSADEQFDQVVPSPERREEIRRWKALMNARLVRRLRSRRICACANCFPIT